MADAQRVSLEDRGFNVICRCVAVIRLHDQPGFAVGVQESFRGGGDGEVWRGLSRARQEAATLAKRHRLPVVESI